MILHPSSKMIQKDCSVAPQQHWLPQPKPQVSAGPQIPLTSEPSSRSGSLSAGSAMAWTSTWSSGLRLWLTTVLRHSSVVHRQGETCQLRDSLLRAHQAHLPALLPPFPSTITPCWGHFCKHRCRAAQILTQMYSLQPHIALPKVSAQWLRLPTNTAGICAIAAFGICLHLESLSRVLPLHWVLPRRL